MQNPSLIAITTFTPNKNPRPNMHGDPLIWRSSKPLEHLCLTSRHLVLHVFRFDVPALFCLASVGEQSTREPHRLII